MDGHVAFAPSTQPSCIDLGRLRAGTAVDGGHPRQCREAVVEPAAADCAPTGRRAFGRVGPTSVPSWGPPGTANGVFVPVARSLLAGETRARGLVCYARQLSRATWRTRNSRT
jgi:hypothetical protein